MNDDDYIEQARKKCSDLDASIGVLTGIAAGLIFYIVAYCVYQLVYGF